MLGQWLERWQGRRGGQFPHIQANNTSWFQLLPLRALECSLLTAGQLLLQLVLWELLLPASRSVLWIWWWQPAERRDMSPILLDRPLSRIWSAHIPGSWPSSHCIPAIQLRIWASILRWSNSRRDNRGIPHRAGNRLTLLRYTGNKWDRDSPATSSSQTERDHRMGQKSSHTLPPASPVQPISR